VSTPEGEARVLIGRELLRAGWQPDQIVREHPTPTGPADYVSLDDGEPLAKKPCVQDRVSIESQPSERLTVAHLAYSTAGIVLMESGF
jgi:hypothetical protein